jgi:6-phosphogluconate dehydrogenase
MEHRTFAIIGLGKMGRNIALNALDKDYQIVGLNHSGILPDELKDKNFKFLKGVSEIPNHLSKKRIVFLYVPAGQVADVVINDLSHVLEPGDIIVDGGNSYWGDSLRRAEFLKEKNILFSDCGTSGGIRGARNGACFMFGGEQETAEIIMPILQDLAVPEGVVHTGPNGSGHFTKLVHNGIEFGMMQAIGEGVDLLENFRDKLHLPSILHAWSHGSVIRSWLIELLEEQLIQQKGLENIPGYIEDTGEVNWLVDDAMHMEVPVPVISQSVMQLFTSRDKKKSWAKAIAMMRHGFGQHPFGPNEGIKRGRGKDRISPHPAKK